MQIITEVQFKIDCLKDGLLLANGSLNNELTIIMQNLDILDASTSQLRDKKKGT